MLRRGFAQFPFCDLLVTIHTVCPALPCGPAYQRQAPGYQLQPGDFVLVTSFDRTAWAAEYGSTDPELRPSSDSPLLVAALSCGGTEYGWAEAPHVVLHGHALADGEGGPVGPCR